MSIVGRSHIWKGSKLTWYLLMAEKCDVLVVGAGAIGLAVGSTLAKAGREVLVLERHGAIGAETSSRNSEVIHAGIYYPTGSLKARMCVRGKDLLYTHCIDFNVPHERIGKIIVATKPSQFDTLRQYQRQARENGAGELAWIDETRLQQLEPEVNAIAGVLSPTTGIIDSLSFMLSLEGLLESHGGMIAFRSEVQRMFCKPCLRVEVTDMDLEPRYLINAAGLNAPNLGRDVGRQWSSYYAKGHYYTLSGKSPFNRLVYPIAEADGLGVHVTLDVAHQARFGPDVVWIDEEDYSFDDSKRSEFIRAIRAYYPGLDETLLHEGYTGIRPKLLPQGQPAHDFVVNGPRETGIPGYFELLGIESPGLTASLAIAERIFEQIGSA